MSPFPWYPLWHPSFTWAPRSRGKDAGCGATEWSISFSGCSSQYSLLSTQGELWHVPIDYKRVFFNSNNKNKSNTKGCDAILIKEAHTIAWAVATPFANTWSSRSAFRFHYRISRSHLISGNAFKLNWRACQTAIGILWGLHSIGAAYW